MKNLTTIKNFAKESELGVRHKDSYPTKYLFPLPTSLKTIGENVYKPLKIIGENVYNTLEIIGDAIVN